VGESRLRIHPSTTLVLPGSRIVIENGMLRLGMDFASLEASALAGDGYDLRTDRCRIHLYNAVLHTIGHVWILPTADHRTNSEIVIRNRTVLNGQRTFRQETVEIGEGCLSPGRDRDGQRPHDRRRRAAAEEQIKEVTIGNHCWIGRNATILKGVTIGHGAIVAATQWLPMT